MKHDADLGRIQGTLRETSRRIFSKQYRLEIAAAVGALPPPIWSRRLAGGLGIAENQVASELGAFLELGALEIFPSEHDRRKLYLVVPHPLWSFSREILEETIRGAAEVPEEAVRTYWAATLEAEEPAPLPERRG